MARSTATAKADVKTGPAGRIDMHNVQERQKADVERFKERSAETAEQTQKFEDLRTAWQQALETKDVDKLKILNATFETAGRESAQNKKDLSSMMFALLDGYKEIGVVIKAAEEFATDEKKLITDSDTLLKDAEGKLVQAQAMQFNLLGRRDRAIAAANTAIETAKATQTTAKQQAEAMRRTRLNSMDLTQSLQLQQSITQELTDVAQARIAEIETNLASVQANVTLTMDNIKADTAVLEELDTKLAQADGELATLNEELVSYKDNSSEWQECRERILNKTRERDNFEADRNAAFMRTQEGQRFIEFNKMEEQGQVQLLAQHKNWISLLQMGAKQRDVLYEVHMGLVRGVADQEAMSMIDQVATETDERLHTEAALKTQAMRKNTMDRLNRIPEQVRRMREVTGADVDNQVAFEKELAAKIDEFHKNFGSDVGYDDRATHRDAQPAA